MKRKYRSLMILLVIVFGFYVSPVKALEIEFISVAKISNFCQKTASMWQVVGYGLYALKIVIPLLIIILGIVDFTKAILSNDEAAINKKVSTLIQRVIMGVVIFLIPTIISIIMDIIPKTDEVNDNIEACETCLLKPFSEECSDAKK